MIGWYYIRDGKVVALLILVDWYLDDILLPMLPFHKSGYSMQTIEQFCRKGHNFILQKYYRLTCEEKKKKLFNIWKDKEI